MAEIQRWQTLTCACGSTRFYQVFELRRMAGAGLSRDPVGERCAGCHKDADTAAMLRQMQLERKRQELEALSQEMDSLEPQSPPPASSRAKPSRA